MRINNIAASALAVGHALPRATAADSFTTTTTVTSAAVTDTAMTVTDTVTAISTHVAQPAQSIPFFNYCGTGSSSVQVNGVAVANVPGPWPPVDISVATGDMVTISSQSSETPLGMQVTDHNANIGFSSATSYPVVTFTMPPDPVLIIFTC